MKLNLGCGFDKKPGYVNLDKYSACCPDLIWDMETVPWPFEDNVAEEIVMSHVLEHLGATVDGFLAVMGELYRVLRPDGRLIVTVPHPRSDLYLGDPTHVRPITPDVLSLFSRRLNLQWQQDGSANTPLALYTGIDFEIEAVNSVLLSPWRERFAAGEVSEAEVLESAARHFNVIGEMEITLRAVK